MLGCFFYVLKCAAEGILWCFGFCRCCLFGIWKFDFSRRWQCCGWPNPGGRVCVSSVFCWLLSCVCIRVIVWVADIFFMPFGMVIWNLLWREAIFIWWESDCIIFVVTVTYNFHWSGKGNSCGWLSAVGCSLRIRVWLSDSSGKKGKRRFRRWICVVMQMCVWLKWNK